MPPLDHATLQAVLDKQGMPNTTENLNRIAQFAAVAPDMLDKYLGRGTDQSYVDSNVNNAITKSIASTDAAPAADPRLASLAGPNPYKVTLDPNTGLSNIGPGLVNTPEPRGGGGGGRGSPNAGRRGTSAVVEPSLMGMSPQEPQPQAQGNNLDWLLPSLLPALKYLADKSGINAGGASRAPAPGGPWNEGTPGAIPEAEYAGRMPRPGGNMEIQAPQQRLPPGATGNAQLPPPQQGLPPPQAGGQSSAPPPEPAQLPKPGPGNRPPMDPAQKAEVQAQVDAENEHNARLEEDKARKLRAQMNARETAKAAGRVFRK